jgi:hypothetical protein
MTIRNGRGTRRAAIAIVALAIVGGGSAALASAHSVPRGETFVPSLGISVPNAKIRVLEHSSPHFFNPPTAIHQAVGKLRTATVTGIPGRFLPQMRQTPFPPELLTVTRAWQTSNGRTLTAVYAGVNPANSGEGRIVIFRQNIMAGTQSTSVLNVEGSGSLSFVRAPLGVGAETAGQTGELILRGAHGATITLHLSTNSVS